jgi:hypothetical protein
MDVLWKYRVLFFTDEEGRRLLAGEPGECQAGMIEPGLHLFPIGQFPER